MKLNIIAAAVMSIVVAGCGGGNDSSTPSTASTTSTGTSGSSGTTGTTGTGTASGTAAPAASGSEFLTQTSQVGQSQLQQSQAATQKSSNPEVQALAQQTTNEINIFNQQITQVSQTTNVTVNNNVTQQQQTQINTLNTLSGTEFDRTYVAGLVSSWRALLATTLAQARQGTDVTIRQTASANVLTIEQRLTIAQELLAVLQPGTYLMDAYEDGLLEIQLGQLALQKATTAEVKAFAQHMIDEHTTINSRIAALAQQKNVTLPTAPGADKQQIVALISSFSGISFDKAYMDRNVLIHAEDVSKTTTMSQRSPDADIKALAAQGLPMLQEHLDRARTVATSLQGSQLYQLAQSVTTEIQIAQFVQTRSSSAQVKTRAQQTISVNQTIYVQLVQLAQQRNETIPLNIQPERVPAVLRLARLTGAEAEPEALSLLDEQAAQSLQITQTAQVGDDAAISSLARTRTTASGTGTSSSSDAGTSGGGASTTSLGSGSAATPSTATTPSTAGSTATTTSAGGSGT